MINEIRKQLQDHRALIELLERDMAPLIAEMIGLISTALTNGNKLLVMGNGGSAADSQHFVAEIVGRFKMERRALPAVALSTDTSILTAIGNDTASRPSSAGR
jgi:D-sedoheptulose 7-phosphate isomerase